MLGSEGVYKEWGCTAWSRARAGTRFYAVEPEVPDEHHTGAAIDVDRFVGDAQLALGPEPEGRDQRLHWRRAHADLRRQQLQLGHEPARASRGHSIEL